jgi:hypothetical protein
MTPFNKIIDQCIHKRTYMDFFKDLSRDLLNNSNAAHKLYNSKSRAATGDPSDAAVFYELAVRTTTAQMAFLEHTRVKHMLLKSTFESFQ